MDVALLARVEHVKAAAADWNGRNYETSGATAGAVPAVTSIDREHGNTVLDDVETFIGRFVAYPSEHARVAHTLWIAHTHAMDAWDSTPRMAFLSPEPGSGKTRALEVSELLVPRPVQFVNVSAAYLFRKVDDSSGLPTVLFDEIDTIFGPKAREHEDVRGLLNAGHRKGAVAGRCVVHGKTVETVEYSAYCAVALAGLGNLPDTLLTRSIVVRMRRRAPTEKVESFRPREAKTQGHRLRDRLAAWAPHIAACVAQGWPKMPIGIEDRDADVWEALLAVADAAGGGWPKRAREAAVAFVAQSKESTPSLGIRLLADLRTVFADHDSLSTEAILAALNSLDEAPWAEIAAGKPLNARGLANRLRGYSVNSQTIRVGEKTPKGYTREALADAWTRYLSPRDSADDAESTEAGDTPSKGDKDYLASSPAESETSATRATGSAIVSTGGLPTRHDGESYWQNVAIYDGSAVADVSDVADFLRDKAKSELARNCADCGTPLPDGWHGHYCGRHGGGSPDRAHDPWSGGEEGIL